MNQTQLIHNTDWDFLVILDACRYDFFNELYPCEKAISPATWTMEWLNRMWPEWYPDITYISGNVYCANHTITKHHRYGGKYSYTGNTHFSKVVNVWNGGWNKTYGTVLPIEVNRAFSKEYLKNPKKKYILHYMQPHRPYITLDAFKVRKRTASQRMSRHIKGITQRHRPIGYIPERYKWIIGNAWGHKLPPYAKVWLKEGNRGLDRIYKDEIRNVMNYVTMLTDSISGKWVITGDHGERLHHWLLNGHGGASLKDVIEVPWLEVEGGEQIR